MDGVVIKKKYKSILANNKTKKNCYDGRSHLMRLYKHINTLVFMFFFYEKKNEMKVANKKLTLGTTTH